MSNSTRQAADPTGQRSSPLRLMLVATNFPPDASVGTMRSLRLVRYLADVGWNVDVVTSDPSRYRPGAVTDPALLARVPATVRILRARALRPFERATAMLKPRRRPAVPAATAAPAASGIRAPRKDSWLSTARRAVSAALAIPDREVSWLLPAVTRAWRATRGQRPDVIYSSGPPFTPHFVAATLARLMNRPWVAEFRDPWARAPWREDRFAFERAAWKYLERVIINRADAVVFVTEANRDDFVREYGPEIASRFHLVTNGCDSDDFASLTRRPDANGRFVLLHAGSLYGARNPAPLLRALTRVVESGLVAANGICARFIGRGGVTNPSDAAIVSELQSRGIVEFVDHMPRHAALQQMVDASLLLILQPVTTVAVPAKLYEYMAAGRPILALAEPGGDTYEIVRRSRAGVSVLAEDENAIADALASFVRQRQEPFTPVDRGVYDGRQRAAEIAAICASVARPQRGVSAASQWSDR